MVMGREPSPDSIGDPTPSLPLGTDALSEPEPISFVPKGLTRIPTVSFLQGIGFQT